MQTSLFKTNSIKPALRSELEQLALERYMSGHEDGWKAAMSLRGLPFSANEMRLFCALSLACGMALGAWLF
jgi:hypothetical protein